jgi:site-specific recombinase XerD
LSAQPRSGVNEVEDKITSVHVKFRDSIVEGKDGVLYFQLIRKRKIKLITSCYRIYPEEWDMRHESVQWKNATNERQSYLQAVARELQAEVRQIRELIELLDKKGDYSVDELAEHYINHSFNGYLFPFVKYLIKSLNDKKRKKTASIYATVQRSFADFRAGQDVCMNKIDNEILLNYEFFLKSNGVRKNSISCYMRALRSIYNQAVKKGLCTQKQPFAEVYTGIDKTVKRAVNEDVIIFLKQSDLSGYPELEIARDLFLFSFYMRGASFIDMANLTTGNLKNGYITYIRSKTKQKLSIKVEECMTGIIEKYAHQSIENYLLPIYSANNRKHISCLRTYNKRLKRLSEILNLEKPLSSYVARHSWATVALHKGVSVEIISESMGHENEATTRIYLASLGQSVIDKANAMIISLK